MSCRWSGFYTEEVGIVLPANFEPLLSVERASGVPGLKVVFVRQTD